MVGLAQRHLKAVKGSRFNRQRLDFVRKVSYVSDETAL